MRSHSRLVISAGIGAICLLAAGCGEPAPDAAAPSSSPADSATRSGDPVLSPDGYGPLTVGMSRDEAVAAMGPDANPGAVGGPDPTACDEYYPADAPAGLLVMVEDDRLTRLSAVRDSEIVTAAGIGIGDSAEAVMAAYPQAEKTPHKYVEPPAGYLDVWTNAAPDPGTMAGEDARGLRFEIDRDERVTAIRAGGRSIQYVEGCL